MMRGWVGMRREDCREKGKKRTKPMKQRKGTKVIKPMVGRTTYPKD